MRKKQIMSASFLSVDFSTHFVYGNTRYSYNNNFLKSYQQFVSRETI